MTMMVVDESAPGLARAGSRLRSADDAWADHTRAGLCVEDCEEGGVEFTCIRALPCFV